MASPWLRNRADGRLGPRGLRRGAVTVEQRQTRERLIASVLETTKGDERGAIGLLAGCIYELAFRSAEREGPPPDGHGGWLGAIGDMIFQPTSRMLGAVATFFSTEAEKFKKWNGEHVEHVSDLIVQSAHSFGSDLSKQLHTIQGRDGELHGQPMTQPEFDKAQFETRVRDIFGKAIRFHSVETGARVLYCALADILDLLADYDVQNAARIASALGDRLRDIALRFRVGSLRSQAHWAADADEAARFTAAADDLESTRLQAEVHASE